MKTRRKHIAIFPEHIIKPVACFLAAILFMHLSIQAQKKEYAVNQLNNPMKYLSVSSHKENHPFFVDIDNDGDLDCFSGEYSNNDAAKIFFYRNDGSAKIPNFKMVDDDDNPLKPAESNRLSIPYFIDIDNDGDYDCFIGEGGTGAVLYFKNIGNKYQPDFSKQSAAFNPLSMVKLFASSVANPAFGDVDGDGDFDCIITDEAGEANFFKNTGSASFPAFSHIDSDNSPLRLLPSGKSIYNLFLYDWNGDNLTDLLVNTTYYKNIGSQRDPHFDFRNGAEAGFQSASTYAFSYLSARCVDINGDGNNEIFQGNSDGSFVYQTAIPDKKTPLKIFNSSIFPNPSKAEFTLYKPANNLITVRILDAQGKQLRQQTVSGSTWKFGKDLSPGIYVVQLYQNNELVSGIKIIKQ